LGPGALGGGATWRLCFGRQAPWRSRLERQGAISIKKKDISFVKKINNIKNKKNPNFILYFQLSRIHFGWA